MEIAKGISDKAYKALNLSANNSPHWDDAIKIFRNRFFPRYIEPVNLLLQYEENLLPKDKKFGFTIMAIDCLLIETLQCFYEGRPDSDKRGLGKKLFKRFLTQTSFKSDFNPLMAGDFYDQIRCGILHQAETKLYSKILAVGPLVRSVNGSLVINRDKFHVRLVSEFATYTKLIYDPVNVALRKNFMSKMNFISRVV